MLSSRPLAGRSRSSRPLALGLVATVTAVGLTGCSTVDKMQTAAIVNGTRITSQDVTTATEQYNDYLRGGTGKVITEPEMVGQLVQARFVLDYLAAQGGYKPDATFAKLVQTVPDASQSTKDFIASQLTVSSGGLSQEATTAIFAAAAKGKVEVNPRYGAFDPKNVTVSASTPNWIKPGSANPAASPAAAPQQ